MRALVYSAHGQIELQDLPEPEAAPGEVLVAPALTGICGSELEGFRSRSPFRVPPRVMGHEIVGHRVDTGARVAVNPLLSCGVCDLCLRGAQNLCRQRALLGVHRPGGFAERVAVPEAALHELPDDLPFERAVLAEPLANAVHAVRLAQQRDPQPQRVAVIGAGMLGLATGLVALRIGVADVAVTDPHPARLATAAAAGLRPLPDGLEGEFDVIVDAVGAPATRAAAMAALRPGGTVVWLGLHSAEAGIDGLALTRLEQCVLGTFAYVDRDFRNALAMATTIDPSSWLATEPLERGAAAFLDLVEAPGTATKTALSANC
jgi:2-desacetyl-2-hydroxyethyl bacteriochlorophyllide A dehydrogenase